MDVEVYRKAGERRDQLRALHAQLQGRVDGFVTLAHIGPGQVGQLKQGTPWYNDASSAIGAPTFNLPILRVDGVPLGIQVMGFAHEDANLAAMARWMASAWVPLVV
jgi:Asp-tRNA(Asn)/Glu-tRNA(Gln) amidotransferase A subunit family amidase